MQVTSHIDTVSTVNEIVSRYPETIAVFNQFGIDSCCGGGAPLVDAARRDGADPEALLAALQESIEHR